jgi:hypothetical protein
VRKGDSAARKLAQWTTASGLVVLLGGCRSAEEEKALLTLDDARKRLAALAPHGGQGLAKESIQLARQALLDAESAVRRGGSRLDLFDREPSWRPDAERALDGVEIAEWVVSRQRAAEEEEARAWLEAAESALDRARASRMDDVHFTVKSRLRRAQAALAEGRRLLDGGELALATERAQEAARLAGNLPPEVEELLDRFGDPDNLRRWRGWVRAAVEESKRKRRPALIVDKRARMAALWLGGKPSRWFEVELGYNGWNRKLHAGDGATPEGLYHVVRRKGKGDTKYYRALLLDYPNEEDRRRFRQAKVNGELAKGATIGGLIEVHGEGGRGTNWTDGCVALTNEEMDFLFNRLQVGSAVAIVGSYDGPGGVEERRRPRSPSWSCSSPPTGCTSTNRSPRFPTATPKSR